MHIKVVCKAPISHSSYNKHNIHENITFTCDDFSLKADSISSLVSALKIWEYLHFEDYYVWAPMVRVRRVNKKLFYIMSVMFWLLSRVFEVTMKNMCIIQVNSSKPSTINIHTYMELYIIQMCVITYLKYPTLFTNSQALSGLIQNSSFLVITCTSY